MLKSCPNKLSIDEASRAPATPHSADPAEGWDRRQTGASPQQAPGPICCEPSKPVSPSLTCSTTPPAGVAVTGKPCPNAVAATPDWLASILGKTTASARAMMPGTSLWPIHRLSISAPRASRRARKGQRSPSPITAIWKRRPSRLSISQASTTSGSPLVGHDASEEEEGRRLPCPLFWRSPTALRRDARGCGCDRPQNRSEKPARHMLAQRHAKVGAGSLAQEPRLTRPVTSSGWAAASWTTTT